MKQVQSSLGYDLIQSQPIHTPERLKAIIGEYPDHLLENIRPLAEVDPVRDRPRDPALVPVDFERYGVQLIGWTRRGMMQLAFDTDYLPLLEQRSRAEPSASFATRRVLQVGGSGNYGSIADAVAAAEPGELVRVTPGQYRESIVLDKAVEIVGDGQLGNVIWTHNKSNLVQWSASGGRIANIRFAEAGKSGHCVFSSKDHPARSRAVN